VHACAMPRACDVKCACMCIGQARAATAQVPTSTVYLHIRIPSPFTLSALKGARSALHSLWALPWRQSRRHCTRCALSMACLLLARRARVPLSLAHPALIPPKHSPVRPRLSCLLTLNCSRVPCSELTSSRSTARLFELIRRRPGSKGGVCSPNSNTRPPGPFHRMIYTLVAAAARGFLTMGPC